MTVKESSFHKAYQCVPVCFIQYTLFRNNQAGKTKKIDFSGPQYRGDYTIGDWTFRVNRKEFFVKGCNWMPADSFHDENPAILEWQLSLVRDARIQLRVWDAGGIRIRLLP